MAQQFKANPTAVPDTDFSPGMCLESMSGSSEGGTAPQGVREYVEASFGFQNEWGREPMTRDARSPRILQGQEVPSTRAH